jgi:hypothetical protein
MIFPIFNAVSLLSMIGSDGELYKTKTVGLREHMLFALENALSDITLSQQVLSVTSRRLAESDATCPIPSR